MVFPTEDLSVLYVFGTLMMMCVCECVRVWVCMCLCTYALTSQIKQFATRLQICYKATWLQGYKQFAARLQKATRLQIFYKATRLQGYKQFAARLQGKA